MVTNLMTFSYEISIDTTSDDIKTARSSNFRRISRGSHISEASTAAKRMEIDPYIVSNSVETH